MENSKDYYFEKTITMLIKHGIENAPLQCLKDNFNVVEAQNGSEIFIIKPKEK